MISRDILYLKSPLHRSRRPTLQSTARFRQHFPYIHHTDTIYTQIVLQLLQLTQSFIHQCQLSSRSNQYLVFFQERGIMPNQLNFSHCVSGKNRIL